MSRIGYLERHFDPGLDVSAWGSTASLTLHQVERIENALAVVILAGTIPRRLGIDATSEELAVDKKRARRSAHALSQALYGWKKTHTPSVPVTDALRQAGAQLDWNKFREEYITDLKQQLRCVATWAIRNDEDRWGRSAIVLLENELSWIGFALRD